MQRVIVPLPDREATWLRDEAQARIGVDDVSLPDFLAGIVIIVPDGSNLVNIEQCFNKLLPHDNDSRYPLQMKRRLRLGQLLVVAGIRL